MRCKQCGEELPERARFCPFCGTSVDPDESAGGEKNHPADAEPPAEGDEAPTASELEAPSDGTTAPADVPAPRKLEEPLEPMGVGAVPLVPVAPPPRASWVSQHPRSYGSRVAGRPGGAQHRVDHPYQHDFPRDHDRDRAAARREEAPEQTGEAPTDEDPTSVSAPVAQERSGSPARTSRAREALRSLAEGFSVPEVRRRRLIAVGVLAVAIVGVAVFVGFFSSSWIGPFAPPAEEAPQVQPPSDGSLAALAEQGEEEGDGASQPEGGPEVRAAVEDYSWEELSQISALIAAAESDEAGLEIAKTYHLCADDGTLDGTQTKDLELSDGTEVSMRVAGFRQDEKADGSGSAGITFIASDGVSEQAMNATGQLVGGWEGSTLRVWMNESLIGELPSEVSDLVVAVEKRTNPPAGTGETGQDVTEDKLWVPSYSEVVGQPGSGSNRSGLYESEGDQYQLFSDLGVTWAEPSSELVIPSGGYWWLRSPDVANGRWFVVVGPEGQSAYGHRPATENAIVMGFCL